jgi:hypothetical protein
MSTNVAEFRQIALDAEIARAGWRRIKLRTNNVGVWRAEPDFQMDAATIRFTAFQAALTWPHRPRLCRHATQSDGTRNHRGHIVISGSKTVQVEVKE